MTDTLVDGTSCRGWHVSTRPHNRKVVFHSPSNSWFIFPGTGAWADKMGDGANNGEFVGSSPNAYRMQNRTPARNANTPFGAMLADRGGRVLQSSLRLEF